MATTYTPGQKFNLAVGQQVNKSGFIGTVTEVCKGQLSGMVVVRLERGTVCVAAAFPEIFPV